MAYRDVRGVGGWLAFLIIGMTILGPLTTIGSTVADIAAAERANPALAMIGTWQEVKLVTWGFTIAQVALFFSAGWRLNYHHVKTSVRYAISILWLAGPLLTLAATVAVSSLVGANGASDPAAGQALARGILSATIWTAYLLRSKRVENTYYEQSWSDPSDAAGDRSETRLERASPWSVHRWSRQRRQAMFFAGAWAVAVLAFALLLDSAGDGYFADYSGRDWPKIWAWALMPPILLAAGTWTYRRFVGAADTGI